jgi:tetratricopeptide (TPR) repeat protein
MKSMDSTEQKSDQPRAGFQVFQLPQRRRLIFCLLLALATLALYNPVTRAPFLNYDDPIYITDNPQVRTGLNWNTMIWSFRTPQALDWHPITWLSYLLDSQMFGMNPAGYHITNVLLHAANAVLLFLILESATGFAWRSLAVAALFALHPINVESVAWISERKNVLSMLFFLVALAAYGWYARRPGVGRYLAVTLAYVLSLMSKAQAITFPFALLLLDYWPLCRMGHSVASPEEVGSDRALGDAHGSSFIGPLFGRLWSWNPIWEKVPWLMLSALSAVVTRRTGATGFSYLAETDSTFPLWIRLGNAAIAYVKYLGKAFWPANLALVYPHPGRAISIRAAAVSTFAIIAVSALAVIFRQRRPFFVGWFWFLGTLVPMIGVVVQIGGHSMADRYAYIPLLGIFVMICWGAAELIRRWHVPTVMYAAATAVILLALGTALHRQVSFWNDNVTLWTHTLEITKENFTAEEDLGMALISEGRAEEALPHLQRAQFLRPGDPLATINLATYQQMLGHYQAALDGYATVIQSGMAAPSLLATARANSGYAHLSLRQYDSAKQDFEAALREQPVNSAAYRGLGLLAQRAGDIAQAAEDYERSVELQPSPVGYLLLGHALEIGRQPEAARAAQLQAARMTQDLNDDIAVVRQLLAN